MINRVTRKESCTFDKERIGINLTIDVGQARRGVVNERQRHSERRECRGPEGHLPHCEEVQTDITNHVRRNGEQMEREQQV